MARIRQSGFSLMEVLVTVLVISIGLLGLAVLQAQALKNNSQAYVRTQAVLRGYDLAERMRANPKGFRQGAYATVAAGGGAGVGGAAAASAPMEDGTDGGSGGAKDCATAQCNPVELARYDLDKWRDDNARVLPLGEGVTCVDSTPYDGTPAAPACDGAGPADVLAIKIWWDGNGDGKIIRPDTPGAFDPHTDDPLYVLSFRL